jgi:hypothetical protein
MLGYPSINDLTRLTNEEIKIETPGADSENKRGMKEHMQITN